MMMVRHTGDSGQRWGYCRRRLLPVAAGHPSSMLSEAAAVHCGPVAVAGCIAWPPHTPRQARLIRTGLEGV